jgi:energy-coupling factor transport system permease protein
MKTLKGEQVQMHNLAAVTKILLAVLLSIASFLTNSVEALVIFFSLECVCLFFLKKRGTAAKAFMIMMIFSLVLYGIQILCGTAYSLSALSAMRMAIMADSIILMLLSTQTQQITAALVQQCHLSYNYAFMVTAVLRFVPDFLEESRSVREAQACRGYRSNGNPMRRMMAYMMVIKPMVFHAISRSQSMAVSLELRGFSTAQNRTFVAETHLRTVDYVVFVFFIMVCGMVIKFF